MVGIISGILILLILLVLVVLFVRNMNYKEDIDSSDKYY